ncbi:MAG: patatin-like phospholipase family protein [Motilibacteraceae bacterium]
MSFGLVLGAGGLPGEAFHRGVLRALHEGYGLDGRAADVVVGTSAGSIVAASLRRPRPGQAVPPAPGEDAPLSATLTQARAGGLRPLPDVLGLAGYAVRPWRLRPGRLVAAALPPGRHSTAILSEPLERRFGHDWPTACTWVVAARRRDGRRVVFGRDRFDVDLPTAVAASCAIPGYFRPVVIEGEQHVDGGVHSPTNADLLVGQRLDLVVVSAPMGVEPTGARPVVGLPLRLAWHAQLAHEVAALRRAGSEVVVVEPGGGLLRSLGLNPVTALRLDEVEERAYERAAALIARRPQVAAQAA